MELSAKQLALFYAKDIITLRNLDENKAESYTQIAQNPPSDEEIAQFMQKRQNESKFNRPDMFFSGRLKLNEEFSTILNALVTKDGLVPDDKKDDFRNKLKLW